MQVEKCAVGAGGDGGVDQGRRLAIKKIAAGVGVVAGLSVLPQKWTEPVIGKIVLPAHAQTSGATHAYYQGTFRPDSESPIHTFCMAIEGGLVTFSEGSTAHPEEAIAGGGTLGGSIIGSNAITATTLEVTIVSRSASLISLSLFAYPTGDRANPFGTYALTCTSIASSCVS